MSISNLILLALFIEAIVDALKPIWSKDSGLSLTQIVSMAIGVLVACVCRFNMVAEFMPPDLPAWINWVWYVMTGIAIGRGPSFLFDLWERIKQAGKDKLFTK